MYLGQEKLKRREAKRVITLESLSNRPFSTYLKKISTFTFGAWSFLVVHIRFTPSSLCVKTKSWWSISICTRRMQRFVDWWHCLWSKGSNKLTHLLVVAPDRDKPMHHAHCFLANLLLSCLDVVQFISHVLQFLPIGSTQQNLCCISNSTVRHQRNSIWGWDCP